MRKTYALFHSMDGAGANMHFVTRLKEESEMKKFNTKHIGWATFYLGTADITEGKYPSADEVQWYIEDLDVHIDAKRSVFPIFLPI